MVSWTRRLRYDHDEDRNILVLVMTPLGFLRGVLSLIEGRDSQ